jgi:hypothetical protein
VPKSPLKHSLSKRESAMRVVIAITALTLAFKLFWLWRLPGHGLVGADGESYLGGVDALDKEGFFSKSRNLHYWPAGYPVLILPFKVFFGSSFIFVVALAQSLLYSSAIITFIKELSKRRLNKTLIPLALLLNFSPTLSLNSLVIGYEVPTASLLLFSVSALLKYIRNNGFIYLVLASLSLSIASFMQPRLVLISLGVLIPFCFLSFNLRKAIMIFAIAMSIVLVSPLALALRNLAANDFFAVSTNLGVTMNIGAGDNASGGYSNDARGVECSTSEEANPAKSDTVLVGCVVKWYAENPLKAITLFVNKFVFHWSPWFGPLSNGTSARNPWLKFNPLVDISSTTPTGYQLIFGEIGKAISWLWLLFSIGLLFRGFIMLRRRGGASNVLAWSLMLPVILNSISSMGTIGDNRFRIPTLTLSVILQGIGLLSLYQKNEYKVGIDGPPVRLFVPSWKTRHSTDNLHP